MAIFYCDLLRTTRRGRVAAIRMGYGFVLLVALALLYLRWFPDPWSWTTLIGSGRSLEPVDMARFAEQFTTVYLGVQFAAVLLLTPACTAGAIAEERQRRTLDDLHTTELTNLQIVAGKLGARVVQMLGVLLTGLPVLALIPLWGGVDPRLVLTSFGICAVTVLSLGALGVYCSAVAQTVRGAIGLTYLYAGAFGLWVSCLPFVQYGSPFYILYWVYDSIVEGLPDIDWVLVLTYATVHLFLAALLTWAAARQLRKAPSRRERYRRRDSTVAIERQRNAAHAVRAALLPAPPVSGRPLVWKELYFADRSVIVEMFEVLNYFFPVFALVYVLCALWARQTEPTWRLSLGADFGFLTRCFTVGTLSWMAVGVALRAAVSVVREREQRSLDSLVMLPDGRGAVLRAKWLASLLPSRGPALGLLAVWIVAACLGGLQPLAVPLLALAGTVHLVFAASWGLFLSVRCHATERATFLSILGLLLCCTVPPLVAYLGAGLPATSLPWAWSGIETYLEAGLTPVVTWWRLSFDRQLPSIGLVLTTALGLATYALAAWAWWRRTTARFGNVD